MPRIAASNIEEHIRLQTERILDAASTLFSDTGYRCTDMGDIAKSMGLARNSLYRYYASKDHILVAVMKRDMAPIAGRIAELEERFTDPAERIDAWLELQIELATGPCHAMIKMLGDVGDASDELRAEIHTLHEPPNAVLESTIAELLEGTDRDAKLIGAMIVGMVQGAAALAMQKGNAVQVISEMKKSVRKIFTR
jgi:AcrR family transcriptional regulator